MNAKKYHATVEPMLLCVRSWVDKSVARGRLTGVQDNIIAGTPESVRHKHYVHMWARSLVEQQVQKTLLEVLNGHLTRRSAVDMFLLGEKAQSHSVYFGRIVENFMSMVEMG